MILSFIFSLVGKSYNQANVEAWAQYEKELHKSLDAVTLRLSLWAALFTSLLTKLPPFDNLCF